MKLKNIMKRIVAGPFQRHTAIYRTDRLNWDYAELENARIASVDIKNIEDIEKIRKRQVMEAVRRLLNENTVIYAYYSGQIAGHAMLQSPAVGGVWKDRYFIHYCFVTPEFRGNNIYPYMLTYLLKEAFQSGAKEVYISVDFNNYASIRGIEKAGFKKYGILTEKGWGGIPIFRKLKETI